MFWREGQGWQIKTVLQVIGESKEKIGKCSGGSAKGGRARQLGEAFGPSQGAAAPPPCGNCIKTLAYLFCKGNTSGGLKLRGKKV